MDDMQEILEDFLIEAFELIEQIDHDLVELEANPEDLELLNRIFRVAHTIKGSSSFLNFDVLTKLTHHMEDVLNKARRADLKITPDIMDVVLESVDTMKALLKSIRDSGSDASSSSIDDICSRLTMINEDKISDLDKSNKHESVEQTEENTVPEEVVSEIKNILEKDELNSKSQESTFYQGDISLKNEEEIDVNSLSEAEVEAEIERLLKARKAEDKARKDRSAPSSVSSVSNDQDSAIRSHQTQQNTTTPSSPPKSREARSQMPATSNGSSIEQTIRVEVKRLDSLMNLIGELVLGKNRLLKIYDDVEERYEGEKFLEELNQVVSSLSLVTTDIQLAVMKTRMLPIAKVFNKFPRMVRDLSRELKKHIDLEISGEETELDKSIVEEIGDPLVHIIRNSCDHGIETPQARAAAGKNERGIICLKAYNEGNHIVVEIVDDGGGMDSLNIRMKAVERGIITEREADAMSDKEALALIFKPGFSLAKQVTNVSGRGVGMDVVKTNIEKLNGVIDIESEIGKGTVIKLKIPLTLAIIQSLLVGSQEEYYAIPLASVKETVRIPIDDIYTIEGKNVLRLRDEVLSLVRLSDLFGVKQIFEASDQTYVVVINVAESKLGLIVDNLIGQEEIVIKSLGNYLQNIRGIAGGTIRGDGKVTLIVDVGMIMDMAKDIKIDIRSSIESTSKIATKEKPSDYKVLIVDDSKMDRVIMQKSLEPMGVTVLEATNGVEALNMMKSNDFSIDAILIDIEMPRMDGYTLAGEIRKYSKYRQLPLIAVTSRTSKSDRLRGVEVGMTEYITKPYSPEYLENVVRKNIKLV